MNLVVGEYLEIMGAFDGVCLIKDSFKDLTGKYPQLLETVQQYRNTYGDKVLDLGACENKTHAIYVPLHNISKVRETCEELQTLVAQKGFNRILMPMPSEYGEYKELFTSILDDRFTVITDDPDYIQEIKKGSEPMKQQFETKRVLECSSKGDTRFSALYAKVKYMNTTDTIENIYQSAKRFVNPEGEYVQYDKPKGKAPDGVIVFDVLYDIDMLTPFYTWLWIEYFRANPSLLQHASTFDEFNDMFKGKAQNCQADVIRDLVHNYEDTVSSVSFMDELNVEWLKANGIIVEETVVDDVIESDTLEDFIADTTDEVTPITLVVTGHRPKDLWKYNPCAQYHALQDKIYKCVLQFINNFGVTRCINGGAQGADQLFFWAVDHIRNSNDMIENVVYQPFVGQHLRWKETGIFSQAEYNSMLSKASHVHTCFPNITSESPYQAVSRGLTDRNTEMVKVADYVLGVFCGDPHLITTTEYFQSGTLDCLRKAYAMKRKIVVINPMTMQTTRIGF